MFEIKYRFAGNYTEDLKAVDEMTLRYELFTGSLWLEKDDKKIAMDWKWIPLLDFALCLRTLCNHLGKQPKGEEVFDFTESDATLTFRREENKCELFASFSDTSFIMSFTEFQEAVQQFCEKVGADILSKNEGLKNNRVFKKTLKNVGF